MSRTYKDNKRDVAIKRDKGSKRHPEGHTRQDGRGGHHNIIREAELEGVEQSNPIDDNTYDFEEAVFKTP